MDRPLGLRPMWHKPEGWSEGGPALNGWIEGHETRHLKKLWDFLMQEDDFDPGCFLAEAIKMEMQYRGEGGYVAL